MNREKAAILPMFTESNVTGGRKWSLKICMELDPIFLFMEIHTLENLSRVCTNIYVQISSLQQYS